MKSFRRLKITENLLRLERGNDELLLANYLNLRPLYARKGRKYITNFLKIVSELASYEKITAVYPQEINLLDTLLEHGIIVPCSSIKDNKLPDNLSEGLCFDNRESMSLYLLISQSCNMGCVYCLNGAKTYQKDKGLSMGREVAFRSIKRCLESLAPGGYLEVIFFGGEPLLNWPLAKEIIIYSENSLRGKHAEKKLKFHFTSNLSFIPADLIEWAKKHHITFLCDVDGPKPIHDLCRPFKDGRSSYEATTRNIKRLVEAGLKVDLRATITALNQDYFVETTNHHKAIGGKSSAFVPVNPVNSDEVILAERLLPSPSKIIKGMTDVYKSKVWQEGDLYPFNQYAPKLMPGSRTTLGCGAPYGNTAIVDVNGDVYPCIYLVGIKRFYLGNIMNESYPNKNRIRWMYDYLYVDHLEDCKFCPWRYICGGGCPLGRLTVLNNPMATEETKNYCRQINCEYIKKMMELVLWDKAEEAALNLLTKHRMQSEVTGTIHC